jgi:hypothetical protein
MNNSNKHSCTTVVQTSICSGRLTCTAAALLDVALAVCTDVPFTPAWSNTRGPAGGLVRATTVTLDSVVGGQATQVLPLQAVHRHAGSCGARQGREGGAGRGGGHRRGEVGVGGSASWSGCTVHACDKA